MHDSLGMTLRHPLQHLISKGLHHILRKWLIITVHILLEVLIKKIEDKPEPTFAVDKVLQGADVGMRDFFQ